jgi:tetratricopeptide (TPR) repeat protein
MRTWALHLAHARVVRLALLAPALAGCAGRREVEASGPVEAVAPDARAAFAEGVAEMAQGADRYDAALVAFDRALRSDPRLWEAWINIGTIELRRARLSAAAKAFEASIAIEPSAEALAALGDIVVRQGRHRQAIALYERALQRNPGDLRLRNGLAVALRHAGRTEQAEAELRAVLGRDAGNVDAYATLAAIQIDAGRLDLAELLLNKGLARTPDAPPLLVNLGLVALRRGDDQAAFALFDQASALDPGFVAGRLNKAAVYLGAGDHARARVELEAILQLEPGNTDALLGLGVAQRVAGELDAAEATWQRLLTIDGDNPAAHYNLAVLAMDFRDQPSAARPHLERFLALQAGEPGDRGPRGRGRTKPLRDGDGAAAAEADDDPRVTDARDRLALLDAMAEG